MLCQILPFFLLVGCKRLSNPEYPQWHIKKEHYHPTSTSSNAFDDYALAALHAEAKLPRMLHRTNFTPGMKNSTIEKLQEPMQTIRNAKDKHCQFIFRTYNPFETPPYQKGWSILGKSLCWNIEKALCRQDIPTAIMDFIAATKFGFDLTSGNCLDASLGLTVVDNARKAILKGLEHMSPEQLKYLAHQILSIHNTRPNIQNTYRNERESMLAAVQYIQDATRQRKFKSLQTNLGPDCKQAISYLRKIANKNQKTRLAYFKGFAAEAEIEINNAIGNSQKPTIDRGKNPIDTSTKRPWRKFSKHFFGAPHPLMTIYDRSLARTRLLILTLFIMEHTKTHHATPKNLTIFPQNITIDPFAGQRFRYRSDGVDYQLYSIGENLKDNGGISNEAGIAPDLVLEPGGTQK